MAEEKRSRLTRLRHRMRDFVRNALIAGELMEASYPSSVPAKRLYRLNFTSQAADDPEETDLPDAG